MKKEQIIIFLEIMDFWCTEQFAKEFLMLGHCLVSLLIALLVINWVNAWFLRINLDVDGMTLITV